MQVEETAKESAMFVPQIHGCSKYGCFHVHLVTGPCDPSWPVWDYKTGVKLIDFAIAQDIIPDRFKKDLMKSLRALHETQKRDPRGRFSGRLLPRSTDSNGTTIDQASVVNSWQGFKKEGDPAPYYIAWYMGMSFVSPLFCDFVHREGEAEIVESTKNLKELTALLKKCIARPQCPSDIGLNLDVTPDTD